MLKQLANLDDHYIQKQGEEFCTDVVTPFKTALSKLRVAHLPGALQKTFFLTAVIWVKFRPVPSGATASDRSSFLGEASVTFPEDGSTEGLREIGRAHV